MGNPVITSLSPLQLSVTATNQMLTLTGSGFTATGDLGGSISVPALSMRMSIGPGLYSAMHDSHELFLAELLADGTKILEYRPGFSSKYGWFQRKVEL